MITDGRGMEVHQESKMEIGPRSKEGHKRSTKVAFLFTEKHPTIDPSKSRDLDTDSIIDGGKKCVGNVYIYNWKIH